MIRGFSSAANLHTFNHLAFDSAMPMPFKIPKVLETLLNPDIDIDYTNKQKDLIEALRFSMKAKAKLFNTVSIQESDLISEMTHEQKNTSKLKEQYNNLQTQKLEASEMIFDIINALEEELESSQYKKLLEISGINL